MDWTGALFCLNLLLLITLVETHPTGAPAEACTNIYPVGHAEIAASQNLRSNPFHLDLSDLDRSNGGTLYYIPQRTYTVTLSGSGGEQFRGFLVQARTVADGSPVGVFTDTGPDVRLSFCSPPESAVTHPSADNKSSVSLTWTAPPEGSGDLHILFAVVREFNMSSGTSIFWATAMTDEILACGPPLYQYDGLCVETCPPLHIGNDTTGHCEPFSSNYVLSLNATTYYANLTSETPLETAVFYLQLSINLSIVPEMAIYNVVLRFNQNQLVQRLFEFEHGDNNVYDATNDLQSNGSQAIVRTSLNLTELPAANEYPVDVDMTITVSLLYMVSNMYFTDDTFARGIASIVMAPGPCEDNSCQNGGSCVAVNSSHFTCECPHPFTGQSCGEELNACLLHDPCDHGTCDAVSLTEYICNCSMGYTGQNCSELIVVCELDPCVNGTCIAMGEGMFVCVCSSGYTGNLCDEDIRDCNTLGCSGNGNCTSLENGYYCECYPGWTGERCEISIGNCDPNPCANNGTCVDDYGSDEAMSVCMCSPGWTGTNCTSQISGCELNPCENNGTCTDNCTDSTCFERGFSCMCVAGYTGDVCEKDDPEMEFCQSDSCANSGTCVEEHGPEVGCICTQEFTGPTCEETVETCTCLDHQVIYAIIGAASVVMLVTVAAIAITLVMVVRYTYKAKAKYNLNQQPRVNGHEMYQQRSFSNTDSTGIYFSNERSTVLNNQSASLASQPPAGGYEQPIASLSRYRVNGHERYQQRSFSNTDSTGLSFSSDRSIVFTNLSDSQASQPPASEYEQPIASLARHRQRNIVGVSPYEIIR